MTNPFNQIFTAGIINKPEFIDHQSDLTAEVIMEYKRQPDQDLDGGNDKDFFSMTFQGIKVFVTKNEINGLTIMLPEEY